MFFSRIYGVKRTKIWTRSYFDEETIPSFENSCPEMYLLGLLSVCPEFDHRGFESLVNHKT